MRTRVTGIIVLVVLVGVVRLIVSIVTNPEANTPDWPTIPPPPPITLPATPEPTVSSSAEPSASTSGEPSASAEPSTTPQPGSYRRERHELTPVELENYGGLLKGDCVNSPPDDLATGVTTVDCSLPHTDQVMGYVDLSEGMPDISDGIEFEMAVARRCNSVKATMPIPEAFDMGVSAVYPGQEEWDAGIRVALCWVPVFDTTWVGSALDGSAEEY